MWSIGAIICIFNNKLQNISLKKKSYEKAKKTKKDTQSCCKVIMFAILCVPAPIF
jgi:hypothetical protein